MTLDIYTEGVFDPEKAAAEVMLASGVRNDALRERDLSTLRTAALVDIANSLSVLSLDAAIRLGEATRPLGEPATEPDDEDAPLDLGPIEVGDWVALKTDGDALAREVYATGLDDGDQWLIYQWEDGHGVQVSGKLWADQFVKTASKPEAPGSEPGDELEHNPYVREGEAKAAAYEAETAPDIADDFGDDTVPDNLGALAALREKGKGKGKTKGAKL